MVVELVKNNSSMIDRTFCLLSGVVRGGVLGSCHSRSGTRRFDNRGGSVTPGDAKNRVGGWGGVSWCCLPQCGTQRFDIMGGRSTPVIEIPMVANNAWAKVEAAPWGEAEGATGPYFFCTVASVAFQNLATVGSSNIKIRGLDRNAGMIYD